MLEITCMDCGAKRMARIRTTRYCRLCRFARNLEAYANPATQRNKIKDCCNCHKPFLPISRGDALCGPCSIAPLRLRGTCVNCEQPDSHLVHEEVPFCATCARTQENRWKLWSYVAELVRAQAALHRADAPQKPPEPPLTLTALVELAQTRYTPAEIKERLHDMGTLLREQDAEQWSKLSQDERLLRAYKEMLA